MAHKKTKHAEHSGHHSEKPVHQTGSHLVPNSLDEFEEGAPEAHLEIVLEGPIDELRGAVLDAGLSGFSEHTLGEVISAAVEHEFWRNTHASQDHAKDGEEFEVFAPAYLIGYTLYVPQRGHERSFDEVEHHLRGEYELTESSLPWSKARMAAQAAWKRVHDAQLAKMEFLKRRQLFSLDHPRVSHSAIAERAWFIYENAGYPQGHALDHWLQAEREQQEHEAIALRAWLIYENAGHPQGRALDHWLRAEREYAALRRAA
jgi:hypothetical protein